MTAISARPSVDALPSTVGSPGAGSAPGVGGSGRHLPCPIPPARGPVSAALLEHLVAPPHAIDLWPQPQDAPLDGEDTHLALYMLYELHYRGVEGVDDRWEWHPDLLRWRAQLEQRFEMALRDELGAPPDPVDVPSYLQELTTDDGTGPSTSTTLATSGTLAQVREEAVLRTAYQLKEADPHSWALPRLGGPPKAALVEIQADEYGQGVHEDVHAELYALTLEQLGLSSRPGAYLDLLPGVTLATVNLVSMFGLHRRLVGALVGHLAVFEMSSVTTMARHADLLRRLGFSPWTTLFYDTHVVADAHHQTLAAVGLAGGLVAQQPERAADVIFGARALCRLEARQTETVLSAWERGVSALRGPLSAVDPPPGRTAVHVPARDPRRPLVG